MSYGDVMVPIDSPDVLKADGKENKHVWVTYHHFLHQKLGHMGAWKKLFSSSKTFLGNINFEKSTFLSFSCHVGRLRCPMVMQMVPIDSSDVLEANEKENKHVWMTYHHFFHKKLGHTAVWKKLFQAPKQYQFWKIDVFVIFLPCKSIEMSYGDANGTNRFLWRFESWRERK